MRIAVITNNSEVSSMDEGEFAFIYENGLLVEKMHLEHREEHPGIYKMSQILPKNVNAVVTKHCGPPGFRLAMSKNISLYKGDGLADKVVEMIERGEIMPSSPEEMGGDHHHEGHRNI